MDAPEHEHRWMRAAAWLQARPIELVGLAVLLVSALGAGLMLWWAAAARSAPTEYDPVFTSPAAAAGHEVHPDELTETGPSPTDARSTAAAGSGAERAGGTADGPVADGSPPASEATTPSEPSGPATVHVTGAVQTQGLVTVPAGARAGAAVDAAGGLTEDAALEGVNLARVVADGEHLHIPRVGEPVPPTAPAQGHAPADTSGQGTAGPDDAAGGPLDLNTATEADLQRLPGIGPAKAAAIVAFREEQGPFTVPGDLRGVSGIGEKTFQALADLVTVR